ncbi:hypothetical protein J0H58_23635 [bacterium]|nr:hypothetical protein [bacterium]
MFDFSVRLRDNPPLLALLEHYVRAGAGERLEWLDRVMALDGVEPRGLTTLHGELIAFGWVEQNTGHVALRPDGALAACYRVTPHGLREFRRVSGLEPVEEQPAAAEDSAPRFPRKRKEQADARPAVGSGEDGDSSAAA